MQIKRFYRRPVSTILVRRYLYTESGSRVNNSWAILYMVRSFVAWWRHQMETFSALLVICAGNSPVPGEFPTQRPVTRSFDVFFDLRLNKRLSKQSWGWWFETPSRPLWRHRNGTQCSQHNGECTETSLCIPGLICLPFTALLLNGNFGREICP